MSSMPGESSETFPYLVGTSEGEATDLFVAAWSLRTLKGMTSAFSMMTDPMYSGSFLPGVDFENLVEEQEVDFCDLVGKAGNLVLAESHHNIRCSRANDSLNHNFMLNDVKIKGVFSSKTLYSDSHRFIFYSASEYRLCLECC